MTLYKFMRINPIIALCLIMAVVSLPSTFDIRYQPQNSIYANFQSASDSICQSYSWTRQLAQILSNRVSVDLRQKITLSAQQITQCVSSENDKCRQTTLKNIEDAIKYIQHEGVTQEDCYKNNFLQLPSKFCARKCTDGQPFVRRFYASIIQQSDIGKLLQEIGNGYSFGFAIVKYFEQMNYYSAEKPQNMKSGGDFYTYGVAEIVGWRKGGEQLNLRMGGSGWGYKGYGFVSRTNPIIVKVYSLKNLGYHSATS